jgi:hypothetical protein
MQLRSASGCCAHCASHAPGHVEHAYCPARGQERINDALCGELAAAGLTLALREDGYHEVAGLPSPLVVAELRVIAAREGDDVLRWLTYMTMRIDEDLEGFYQYAKELMKKLPLEERLEDLAPEQRLAGLAPEQRLAGLSEADRVLALPDADLHASFVHLALRAAASPRREHEPDRPSSRRRQPMRTLRGV